MSMPLSLGIAVASGAPALIAALVGILLGFVFNLESRHLISMPDDILKDGITLRPSMMSSSDRNFGAVS